MHGCTLRSFMPTMALVGKHLNETEVAKTCYWKRCIDRAKGVEAEHYAINTIRQTGRNHDVCRVVLRANHRNVRNDRSEYTRSGFSGPHFFQQNLATVFAASHQGGQRTCYRPFCLNSQRLICGNDAVGGGVARESPDRIAVWAFSAK